jgi:pimeloyl-ACP methyl ester carboxylesterase
MAHKFVPRKGKGKDQSPSPAPAPESAPDELPPPMDAMNDGPVPDEAAEETTGKDVDTKPPVLKAGRSAKDSILKKLPAKGQKKSLLKLEPRKKDRPLPVSQERSMAPLVIVLCLVAGAAVTGGVLLLTMNAVPGYQASVEVAHATRLDWTFVEGRESLEKVPPTMEFWEAKRQRFELYVPPELDKDEPAPAILFLSQEARPHGWSAWQKICQEHKIIYIGPSNVGEHPEPWQRTRAALDAFDEVRRTHKIDPDRTYIAGQGANGAQAACKIAWALPELFGGLVAINGGDLPRNEPWLRQRLLDRLSVAWVVGAPLKPEVEKLYQPVLSDLKVRSQVWDGGPGRGMVADETLAEVFAWLEADLPRRQELAKRYPTARFPADGAPSRPELANMLLTEARQRLAKPETFISGLAQLLGCLQRWPDVPAGKEAFKQHQEYYIQEARPWVQEESQYHRARDLAMARALTAYLTTELDAAELIRTEDRRHEWFNLAINLWKKLSGRKETPKEIVDEADKSIKELQRVRNEGFPISTPKKDKD